MLNHSREMSLDDFKESLKGTEKQKVDTSLTYEEIMEEVNGTLSLFRGGG